MKQGHANLSQRDEHHHGHRAPAPQEQGQRNGGKQPCRGPPARIHGVDHGGPHQQRIAGDHHSIHDPRTPVQVAPDPAPPPGSKLGKGRVSRGG